MTKHVLFAVAALAAGGAIAHFHVAAQSYQPMVRVETPDGISYTAVLDAVHDRSACGVASQAFVAPIVAGCPECRVVFARCRREGEGLPAFAKGGGEAGKSRSLVHMPGVVISVEAPADTARRTCEWMAESAHHLGVAGARCEAPARAASET